MRTDLFLYGRVLNREKDGCKEWPVPNASTLSWKGEPLVYMPFVYEHPEYWKKVLDRYYRHRILLLWRGN